MKITIPCCDHDFKLGKQSGIINGGTSWLWHLCHTFQDMGHEAQMIENGAYIPNSDIVITQSEWYAVQIERLQEMRRNGTKLVVILGHFVGGLGRPYFDPKLIEADLFVSTWKGEVVDSYKQEVKFWPHAFCEHCNKEGEDYRGDLIWVGNNYPLRDEDWLEGLDLTRINGVMPDELNAIYRAAKVLPNRHGDFQKGTVSTIPSTLADVPGFACNERLFQIIGAGGFQVADDNPQIREFFTEEELVCGKDKGDYQEKINFFRDHPESRESFIKKGREKVLAEHTYQHRCKQLLEWLS